MPLLNDYQRTIGRASAITPIVDEAFENACIHILTLAFERMKIQRIYSPLWKETRLSAHLIGHMRDIRTELDIGLQIDPEGHLYRKGVLNGTEDPDTAPRIDIKVSGGWVVEDIYYGMEGKLLTEKDFLSRTAHYLRSRYINTGIDNFRNGIYGTGVSIGCLIGYVVQGSPAKVAKQINALLAHRNRDSDKLGDKHTVNACDDCYQSKHHRVTDNDTFRIKHILLSCQ